MNNFQKLAEKQQLLDRKPPQHIKDRVNGTMGLIDLFGRFLELFVPRAMNVLTDMVNPDHVLKSRPAHFKGFVDKEPPKYPNRTIVTPTKPKLNHGNTKQFDDRKSE